MANQNRQPRIYVPPDTGIFVPGSVQAEPMTGRKRQKPGDAPTSERHPRGDRPERPVPKKKKGERRRSTRRSDSGELPVSEWRRSSKPSLRWGKHDEDAPWFHLPTEFDEGPGGPDEPMTVPDEILALAEEAMTRWQMKVSDMTVAATKPEKGWGAIWRIETDQGPRSLKLLHRPFERNLFSIYAQDYLTSRGARVAPLVRSREGEFYTLVNDRMFIVTEWIQGLHPATKVTSEGAAALCYGLGEFHRHSQGYEPPPEAYYASRLHRWPGVYRKMRTKIDWFEHLARAYPEMPASPYLLEVLPRFRQQADEAIERLEQSAYRELIARGGQKWGLVHQGEGSKSTTSRSLVRRRPPAREAGATTASTGQQRPGAGVGLSGRTHRSVPGTPGSG